MWLPAGDSSVAVADVLFARNLRAANHLLWVCDVTLPDLGESVLHETGPAQHPMLGSEHSTDRQKVV